MGSHHASRLADEFGRNVSGGETPALIHKANNPFPRRGFGESLQEGGGEREGQIPYDLCSSSFQ